MTPTGIAVRGRHHVHHQRGALTVGLAGTLDLTTGEFRASGDVSAATGKLDGATGSLTLAGKQDLLDPASSFTETVSGAICVDLGGTAAASHRAGSARRGLGTPAVLRWVPCRRQKSSRSAPSRHP